MARADDFLAYLADFEEVLATKESNEERKQYILQHFSKLDNPKGFRIPDFDKDLDWVNVFTPLTFASEDSLKGKVVVLDFFTYCCVNCLHVLPDLHQLEEQYSPKDGLVIIGVHSAKFLNEKVTANIISAVLRYDITHAVVNDSDARLWQQLSVSCWPSFVIVGPHGQVLYYIVGEGHKHKLFEFVTLAIEHYAAKGEISHHPLPIRLEKDRLEMSVLLFPGKVHAGPQADQLVLSDTGNHRLLIVDRLTGIVQTVIGGQEKGFCDGSLQNARFSSPQGVASLGKRLFVADTENHALRQVDLETGQVTTLAGTGCQGNDQEGGEKGTQQLLSTPWDVAVGVSPGGSEPDVIYIAMAGSHQIWIYCLKDVIWWKNRHYTQGTCVRVAGSGSEENRNNNYPERAGFAQPSGLAISNGLNAVFVADSESSSVRQLSIKDGSVKALVGGDKNPTNLFAFGDVDGQGTEAKLQHPLGLALLADSGPLLIADSYNHKVKCVDIHSKICTTVLGTGVPGNCGGDYPGSGQLNEPGGLCVASEGDVIYIADTNNHCIKIFDWKNKSVKQLPVVLKEDSTRRQMENSQNVDKCVLHKTPYLPAVTLCPGGHLTFELDLHLAKGLHLNHDAPNGWRVTAGDEETQSVLSSLPSFTSSGSLSLSNITQKMHFASLDLPSDIPDMSMLLLVISCQLFICHDNNTCTQVKEQRVQCVQIKKDGVQQENIQIDLDVK